MRAIAALGLAAAARLAVTALAGRSHFPFGCACGTRFRLRATLPKDSVASSSGLRPFV
jgi:hypothetical protein